MNDEDFIAKMETLHHRFWLQSDAERLLALANALEAKCAALEAAHKEQREADAKICDLFADQHGYHGKAAKDAAAAIRAKT